jgi:glucose/arabinose dehydrogenase
VFAACGGDADDEIGEPASAAGEVSGLAEHCASDDGGLSLPAGFCAILVSEGVGRARHLDVASNGDVFVALRNYRANDALVRGGLLGLRDTDGDGRVDEREEWGENGGTGVVVIDGGLYFATDDAILWYPLQDDALSTTVAPDTIVSGLPDQRSHTAKSMALAPDGGLYVNIGSPSNTCQTDDREPGSPGQDPCPQLETRAGIWRFDGSTTGQTQADGTRFATGLRNTLALAWHPSFNLLYGVQHGRDQLDVLFPEMFTSVDNAEGPAEEFVHIQQGDDFGWPYCYFDTRIERKVLAPEYGGDGEEVGRCAEMKDPMVALPAHWAPNDLEFYTGSQFPERYREGAFIAFHGSWNRAPEPQEGYNVVFVPMRGGIASGDWEVFAGGFRDESETRGWTARPTGLAMAPDGSLYVIDSLEGRLWRIVWRGLPRAD